MLLVSGELNYPCSRQRNHSFGMNALFSGTCSCSDLSQRGIRCDPLATERLGLFTWEHVWYSSLVPIRIYLYIYLVIYQSMYLFLRACMPSNMCVYIYLYIYIYIYTINYMHAYIYMIIYDYIWLYMCVWIYLCIQFKLSNDISFLWFPDIKTMR